MAALRSSLPSRLRQLLSSEGAIGPSVKVDSEPPPIVQAFIDKVIQSPLEDIAIPLSGFRWEYGKGNFHYWRPLFLHFETYFKTHLSCRNDLLLTDNTLEDDCPFPKQAVLQILRVMQIILENCHNKSSFSGLEHFKLLLASTDPEILIATLETLSALVKINPSKLHASGKLVGCGAVNSCLLSLAQGWGSKEEGLGLYSCVMVNERTQEEGLCLFPSDAHNDCDKSQYRLGSTLYFECHGVNSQCTGEGSDGSKSFGGCVIHIPDLHLRKEDDLSLMKQCVEEFNVPPEHRFSLLTRIRYSHAFRSPRICRLYSRVCLLSFVVLVQSSDAHDELVSFFANEPEYTNELIRIVRSEETVPGTIRTLAMHALGAQLGAYSSSHERARILSGSSISFAGANRMILLNVLQRAIFSLNHSNDPLSIAFVEALLQFYLLHVISSSTSGSVVRGSGMVPTFLPLLEDSDPMHMHLVCLAVKTLQKLMDYSNTAVTLFKDLGGVELLTCRLQIEVSRAIGLGGGDDNSMVVECSTYNDDQSYTQKRLVRVLLKALGSATYAPSNPTRSQNTHDASLPGTLSLIFKNVDKFGGDIYSSAVTVMSEIIHKDPTCFPALHELGLPDAFLASVVAGILPSSKALTCVPNGIGAICLNAKGLEAVKETSVLRFLVDVFTSKKYVVAMNDGIVPLANAVEELLRHVSSLRSTGVDLIIEIVNKIASIGEGFTGSQGKDNGSTAAMEMDSEGKENEATCCLVSATDSTAGGVNNEQLIQLCIFHVMVLVHRTMENAETCRLFVEKSGIKALLNLLLRPIRLLLLPMETDDGIPKQDVKQETDNAWIYGPLACYGKLMDHLVTSSFILSPFTKHLFTQPLISGDIRFPRDAETFVKILQSMVLKAVLPVWTHPQFTDCSYAFIATVVSIVRHIYSGVEVKNISSSGGSLTAGPPPNESTIAMIVEMGFSRSRAEEALRHVGSNSVELAMEWLFSHPEEAHEDDELARALMMSLGNSGSDTKEDVADENSQHIEGEMVQPPDVEDLLSTCTKLLQMKESLAFPVRDLLVMICSQNDGQYRSNVISYVIEQVKLYDELARALMMSLGNSGSDKNEDVADENSQHIEGEMVQPPDVEDLLSTCTKLLQMKESLAFPVRDLLVMICSQNDGQYRSNVISYVVEQVKLCNSDSGNGNTLYALFHVLALIFHEDAVAREVASKTGLVKVASDLLSHWVSSSCDMEKSKAPKWVTAAFLAIDRLAQVEQKLNTDIAELFKKDDVGGHQTSVVIDEDKQNKLQSVLGLSQKNISLQEQKRLIEIACGCIRQQLPSETMHSILQLCSTLTRAHSVALSFLDAGGLPSLLSLPTSSLFVGFDSIAATIIRHILEDPQTLQLAMESEIRHSVATAANRQSNGRLTPRSFLLNLTSAILRDPAIFMLAAQSVCQIEMVGERPYIVLLKDRDKDKCREKEKEKEKAAEKEKPQTADGKAAFGNVNSSTPGHGKLPDTNSKNVKIHRKPPHSFVNVIELLLDSVITFVPPLKDDSLMRGTSSLADMDIDVTGNKGKGKAVVSSSEEDETSNQEISASLAKIVFILKLLTEILLMYSSSIHVLLRRDAEVSSFRGIPQRGPTGYCSGGIFHHILDKFLPYSRGAKKEKKTDIDWKHKLASRASQFLVASCVRSTEARKRVFVEISNVFNDFVDSSTGFRPPGNDIPALVDLLNDVVAARTPTGSYISAEASATFMDVGLVSCLTRTLEVLDLDHAESPKVVTGLVKVLEIVTKEHAHATDSNTSKAENSTKPPDQNQHGGTDISGDISQSMDTSSQHNENSAAAEHMESFENIQTYGGSEAVTDDMEHDQDLEGGFAPSTEDDYMHETPDDMRENGRDTVEIRFEIQQGDQENLVDEDDDEMSGDDVDEDEDEDDEENNDLEEDEVHHLPHPDTDQDDHEIDEDEFDEEVMEEDDEDDDDEEEGVILRLEEGMNGINVFDHIEVFGRDHSANETLHVMPVEVFGSRRQGRTTSIYNLLGRTGDNVAPSQHPLLVEPSSSLHTAPLRQSVNSDRTSGNTPSRLDAIFRSLRNGRHGHRFNLWTDDSQQTGGPNSSAVPQALEDLLVSHLRRPAPEKSSDQNTAPSEPQSKSEGSQLQGSIRMTPETPAENNGNSENHFGPAPSSIALDGSGNADLRHTANESLQGNDASSTHSQSVEMQFEQNAATVRDVEAVSQDSSESGATLGESLRSLDVEIGSADGHDDGGERQGSADVRTRRANVSFGNSTAVSSRDAPLHSVTEVSENPSQEADQSGQAEEQLANGDTDSGSIDPAFLNALPEELRAEVLSAQQGQAGQPANAEPQNAGDIDPEFLAALPPDIREEVLAQQQAQRLHQSQELEGQPVEMDTVSIIATFPSELREEVLLTSSHDILANLTPALVAEANMLRERFANRYNRTLFGMYPRNRRGESSRRGQGIGSSLDRAGGIIARRSIGSKPVEAEGAPLVDTEALGAMVRLLRVVQPLYKGQLQRLLLNLCAHSETRTALVKILMDLLMLDIWKPLNHLNATEPSYRLYACQSHVMYSRPQSFDGVPPLVSRRVLETLTYLARNHPYVAKILLQLKLPLPLLQDSENLDKARGKAVMEDAIEGKNQQEGYFSIALLLSLLNQPLYLRSIAHLEQLLNLLEVIIDNAESKSSLSTNESGVSAVERAPGLQISTPDVEINAGSSAISSSSDVTSSKPDVSSKSSGFSVDAKCDNQTVLDSLPQAELRLLCSLLAREGLSDNAYSLASEVLKKLVAIAPTHHHLLISELADSVQNLTKSAMDELRIYGQAGKALLTTSSSDGAAILRVLQALSSLVAAINEKEKDHQGLAEKECTATISMVYDISAALEPLWLELSICISKIERHSDGPESSNKSVVSTYKPSSVMPPLPAGTQNILPYIESFFVMCEKLQPAQSVANQDFGVAIVSDVEDATTSASQQKPSGASLKADEKHLAFVKFSEKNRKLLNAFIRQNPGLLEKSFSLMLKVPRFIDFDNKRAHFRSKIKHQHDHHHSPLRISVRRAYILEDSYNQLRMRSTPDLKGRLTVHFQGEEGIDAGGLTREWYQLLSRVIFDKGALLFTTVGNESTFQPNPNSGYQTEHLSYFKFVGRVVGKALFDGQLLDVHFTRSFYKHILGVKVTYHDIEAIDPDYFKNLKWMLENDITDVLDLTFSIDADEEKLILYERTQVTDYELIPGGRNMRVTEENKHKYVDLVAEHRLTTAIRPQINAFLEGYNELISRDLISIFNDKELELLISGLPDIDLDDMRANTEYSGYSAASPVIQWFWEVVQSFSKEDKARLLQFVTGTSKVPLEGFSALQGISGSQKFQIHKAYGSADHLPSAHTCFNQLDLPEYPSKQHLEERLLLAIHEANEGFGFG
ncbi:E3 ubiquitin-protein like [Actinidia chinensis var. chinensis]|uniref:HECT-type E3 ubiquitin transferase n=1 Tax=Actinidia chinensis var. chinensis TaxID=1590841 RepID=A0A2R6QY61_ACTCC|nr:E3 ubiquitin-protein like [Actinidia chinensis var. chinensis]